MFNKYPYTDMHEMNLDWIISTVKELQEKFDTKFEELTREALDKLFIDTMYIAETETLVLQLSVRSNN